MSASSCRIQYRNASGCGTAAILEWTLRPGRLPQPVPERARWVVRLRFSIGLILHLAAIAVAFVSPLVALALIGAVPVCYIFERVPAVGSSADARQQ